MATFYRGAGVGTYWHVHDARLSGFNAHFPGAARTMASLMNHIKNGTTASPFISMTRSYSIAWNYALFSGLAVPTPAAPAYVYEIVVNDPPPVGLTVLDPLSEIAGAVPSPLSAISYQHDGLPSFLMGVLDPVSMNHHLTTPIQHPPPGGAAPRAANLTPELETLVRALRDAELLAVGTIPAGCVVNRYSVS
jgi:hypothetical protein